MNWYFCQPRITCSKGKLRTSNSMVGSCRVRGDFLARNRTNGRPRTSCRLRPVSAYEFRLRNATDSSPIAIGNLAQTRRLPQILCR